MRYQIVVIILLLISSIPPKTTSAQENVTEQLRQQAQTNGVVRVLVALDVPTEPLGNLSATARQRQQSRIASAQQQLVAGLQNNGSVTVHRQFDYVPGIALSTDSTGIEWLAEQEGVLGISEDQLSAPSLGNTTAVIDADNAWGYGYTGEGWSVAVIDTGVDSSHPFLANKVVNGACFSTTNSIASSVCANGNSSQVGVGAGEECNTAIDGCAHGTHVAGIVAGDNGTVSGVAPSATILAVQVFSRINDSFLCTLNGSSSSPCVLTYTSDQIAGLEQVFNWRNSYNIAAVNMSLGGATGYNTNCDTVSFAIILIKQAIDALKSVNIATIVASGNNGLTNGISDPACISTAISVGATTDNDQVANFSNSAAILDLLAPGVEIYSSTPNNSYSNFSGTSMAAPHVAGAWAVRKSFRPNATVDEILAEFKQTGVSIFDSRNRLAFPRIDVDAGMPDFVVSVDPEPTEATLGQQVTYRYTLTNTGQATLSFTAQDTMFGSLTFPSLNPGETTQQSRQRVVTTDDLGNFIINQVSVTGNPATGSSLNRTDTALVNTVGLEAQVQASVERLLVGETSNLTYTLTSQSSRSLTTALADSKIGEISGISALSARQTSQTFAAYTTSDSDLPGPVTHLVTAVGESAAGTRATTSAQTKVYLTQLIPMSRPISATLTDTLVITTPDANVIVELSALDIPTTTMALAYTVLDGPILGPALYANTHFDLALVDSQQQPLTLPMTSTLTMTLRYDNDELPDYIEDEAGLMVYQQNISQTAWLTATTVSTSTEQASITLVTPYLREFVLTGAAYQGRTYLPILNRPH